MRAIKGNKSYSLDGKQKQSYLNQGFTITDDEGNVIAYPKNKTVPYEQYEAVLRENERLKAEAKKLEETVNISIDINLDELTVEELKQYAAESNIDIGNSTSASGIRKKIEDAQKQE